MMAATEARPPRLRMLHLASACLIGLFLLLHLGNHIAGLTGQEAHMRVMGALRSIYRHPLVEYPLLALIAWQVGSGLTMLVRGWRGRSGVVAWTQALSGAYLAFFLLNHVGAVLGARYFLGLDTDFRFAAAGFHVPWWPLFFAPYYFLAVLALFLHLGCAAYWNLPGQGRARRIALPVMGLAGAALGLAFVLMLAGALYPVDVPDAYRATYGVGG